MFFPANSNIRVISGSVPTHSFFLFSFFLYLFLAALGLRCCVRAFSSCGEQGLLFTSVLGLLIFGGFSCGAQARAWASVVVARRL